jgi:coiled-coil domain-containing protein 61
VTQLLAHALADVSELTYRAGNAKAFNVFGSMLVTALNNAERSRAISSPAAGHVFVDMLTHSDLETLKAKKNKQQSLSSSSSNAHNENVNDNSTVVSQASQRYLSHSFYTSLNAKHISCCSSSRSLNKRYLILTYHNEYDKVHYPLPLNYEEAYNVNNLVRQVNRLRTRLTDKEQNISFGGDKERYCNIFRILVMYVI